MYIYISYYIYIYRIIYIYISYYIYVYIYISISGFQDDPIVSNIILRFSSFPEYHLLYLEMKLHYILDIFNLSSSRKTSYQLAKQK